MGGEIKDAIDSKNLNGLSNGSNFTDSNTRTYSTQTEQVIEWFSDNRSLQYSLFKWIILALGPEDEQEQANEDIRKGLSVLMREISEIQMAGMMHQNVYDESLELLKQCNTFRQTQDSNIQHYILDIIFKSLNMNVNDTNHLLHCINLMTVSQRSVIRFMVHQSIQARVAFIRTTLKTQQYAKRTESEGYHCTTNPYFSDIEKNSAKLKNEIDLKESLNAKLIQELHDVKVQLVQQQEELEKSNKLLAEQVEKNSKIANDKKQLEDHFKSEHEHMQNELDQTKREIECARNETAIYQAQLGNATNIRWSDDTLNNPIQLTKEIENLCRKVDDFAKVKGKSFVINEKPALDLLEKYKSKSCSVDKDFKLLLSFALQRMALELIFNAANKLYKNAEWIKYYNDDSLEYFIIYHTEELIKYSYKLVTKREGQDIIAAMTPIKIRQQSYAALASRGFSNSNHHFIKRLTDELVNEMDYYRKIVDNNIRKGVRAEAEQLIRSGIQLWFNLKIQEPSPKIKWYNAGDQIKTHAMEGHWDNNELNSMEVDFCSFPSIIAEDQVFCKGHVIVRLKQNRIWNRLKLNALVQPNRIFRQE